MVKLIPVYYLGESRRAPAKIFYHPDQIQEWYEQGAGHWNQKQTCFILNRLPAQMAPTPQSLTMGDEVTKKAAEGSRFHLELVAAWQPRFYGIYCEWPQKAA
jgi:hypothetical protein